MRRSGRSASAVHHPVSCLDMHFTGTFWRLRCSRALVITTSRHRTILHATGTVTDPTNKAQPPRQMQPALVGSVQGPPKSTRGMAPACIAGCEPKHTRQQSPIPRRRSANANRTGTVGSLPKCRRMCSSSTRCLSSRRSMAPPDSKVQVEQRNWSPGKRLHKLTTPFSMPAGQRFHTTCISFKGLFISRTRSGSHFNTPRDHATANVMLAPTRCRKALNHHSQAS